MSSPRKSDRSTPARPLSAPLNVCLAVTGTCNLRCLHCYTKDSWRTKGLSSPAMMGLIDQIGKAKVLDVLLYGGEPLLRKDIFSIIERLKRYPLSVSLSTNATLVTRAVSRKLHQQGVRSFVVSLDGMEQAHDAIRGRGSFRKAIRGITYLRAEGGSVVLSFTVSKINILELEKVAALGKKLGAAMVKFNRLNYIGNAADNFDELYITPAEELAVCERVVRLARKYPGFIGGTYKLLYDQLKDTTKLRGKSLSIPVCGAGIDRCAIRPDGGMIPCEVVWHAPRAGKVPARTFLDLWRRSAVLQEFRKPLRVDFNAGEKCASCDKVSACFWGRCVPYYYSGSFKDRTLFCYKGS